MFFTLTDNDTDISKAQLNKAEQVIKLYSNLHLQNIENFVLSASSLLKFI